MSAAPAPGGTRTELFATAEHDTIREERDTL